MAAVGEPAAGSYMDSLLYLDWDVFVVLYMLAHTGGIGICCEEGRE